MNHRLLVSLSALVTLAVLGVRAGPHVHYDDGGNINWKPTYAVAFSIAQKSTKPIFVHASKDKDKASEDQVTMTLRDEKLGQLINRYLVPVSVDFDKPPAEVKPHVDKIAKKPPPAVLIFNERGQLMNTLTGTWQAKDLYGNLLEMLQDKGYTLAKTKEAEVSKQVDLLEKALGEKKPWVKATPIFRNIVQNPGYSPLKDRAYDLLEKAQEGGFNDLKEAYNQARQDQYADAKKSLDKVAKEYVGAPVADQAKEHLGALKIMETAHTLASDPKRKTDAVRQLDQVLTKFPDTPYAALALSRKKDLVPPKTK
jgi:outer membrane protein assembly factor BamD (BamD/ComL family)